MYIESVVCPPSSFIHPIIFTIHLILHSSPTPTPSPIMKRRSKYKDGIDSKRSRSMSNNSQSAVGSITSTNSGQHTTTTTNSTAIAPLSTHAARGRILIGLMALGMLCLLFFPVLYLDAKHGIGTWQLEDHAIIKLPASVSVSNDHVFQNKKVNQEGNNDRDAVSVEKRALHSQPFEQTLHLQGHEEQQQTQYPPKLQDWIQDQPKLQDTKNQQNLQTNNMTIKCTKIPVQNDPPHVKLFSGEATRYNHICQEISSVHATNSDNNNNNMRTTRNAKNEKQSPIMDGKIIKMVEIVVAYCQEDLQWMFKDVIDVILSFHQRHRHQHPHPLTNMGIHNNTKIQITFVSKSGKESLLPEFMSSD